ncbi:MAG TPA: DNA primase [Gammaproteobacteria bacterium]|nr:DNA primase [Gammaproteobacteria bacterium]
MSRRIPKVFINELVARTDLVDLIGARVTLKRAGSNHKGLCPFHDEKTPSFTVSADKGFYKCFGCGAYGNAIDFVMQFENRDFLDAVEILAEMQNLEIPIERSAAPTDENQGLYEILREADQFYRHRLREHPDAIAYLKQRGIDGPTAGRFALGFAPDGWSALVDELGGDEQSTERLVRAGLAARNDSGRVYDRLRNRVIFPIRDGRGRVIGFGGRLLGAGEPKYLNSPDTPLFDKGRTLYGLFEARQQPGRPERLIVVEGFVDVIALDQHGLGPAVATMGTAATADNMRQLTRLSDRVIFCFDGDRAGRDAAWRAVEAILPFGGGKVAIEFVLLPDGEDPDSFVRSRGKDAFADLLGSALPLSSFLIARAAHDLDLGSADGRGRLAATVLPMLAKLPQGLYRELVAGELSEMTGIATERLLGQLETGPAPHAPATAVAARRSKPHGRTVMQKAISLLLHFPEAGAAASEIEGLAEIDAPGADLLRRLLEITAADPKITTGQLIETFRAESEGRWIEQLAREDPLDDESAAPLVLRDSLLRIVETHRRRARAEAIRGRSGHVAPP